jgi:hypothetical protein
VLDNQPPLPPAAITGKSRGKLLWGSKSWARLEPFSAFSRAEWRQESLKIQEPRTVIWFSSGIKRFNFELRGGWQQIPPSPHQRPLRSSHAHRSEPHAKACFCNDPVYQRKRSCKRQRRDPFARIIGFKRSSVRGVSTVGTCQL